ncbi:MAG: rhodanese-like domain-containing protein [Methylococcaceae bacterium]|jgi:rhodanese-related sulfurtransferase
MAYSEKFIQMGEAARSRISPVQPNEVDALLAEGILALDIRDKEEHEIDHIAGSKHISRGKLEMNVEDEIPNLDTPIITYCNVNYRGVLSADSLRAMGYSNVRYIEGGLKAYRAWQNK